MNKFGQETPMWTSFAPLETAFALELFGEEHFKTAWMVERLKGIHIYLSFVFSYLSSFHAEVGLKWYFLNANNLRGRFCDPGHFSPSNLTWRKNIPPVIAGLLRVMDKVGLNSSERERRGERKACKEYTRTQIEETEIHSMQTYFYIT